MSHIEPLPKVLAERLRLRADAFGIPGLAIVLVSAGRHSIWVHGEDAPGSGQNVTEQTWFSVASVGKHVTALAVLDLAQRGLVDLDAPIGRYLTEIPPAWANRSILSLLRHTSGLPEYLSYTDADDVPDRRDEFMRVYAALQPLWDEGQAWMYSNTNYILLGFLIAQMSGVSYGEALHQIFKSFGCTGVAVSSPAWAREANAKGSCATAIDESSLLRQVIGDGDISFTSEGAAAWLGLILGDKALDEHHRSVMFSAATMKSGRPSPYGCAWFVDPLGETPICHHAGHFDGWTAMAYVVPSMGCAALVMCNLAPGNTRAVRYLAQLALEGFVPGSTPLSLKLQHDDAPDLTARARSQFLRQGAIDPSFFSKELTAVAERGGAARNVINLWAGGEPQGFSLIESQEYSTHVLRRYRLTYAERVEHLLVGTTPSGKIYWAWPL